MTALLPPNISVIVPIYNCANIIGKLIPCIQIQTFCDWELLLIDDGSTDNTREVCERYAQNDSRIRVIANEHQGVSASRNAGIESAKGEWITFVDADDLLFDGFLSSLFDAANQSENIDIAYCGFSVVSGSATTLHTYKTKTYVGDKQMCDLFGSSDILYRCSPWAKLFRRSIMMEHHLRFDTNLSISEDRLFFYDYLLYTKGIATTSYVGYIYGSFSSTSLKNKHFPIEMLSYRQEMMTNATRKILDRFPLEGDDAYYLTEHLMKIMQSSMQSAFVDTGLSAKTCHTQEQFLAKHFDRNLYDNLSQSKRWKSQLANNSFVRNILANKFWKLNWKWFCNDFNLRIHMYAHKLLLKRKVSNSYESVIKIINK